MYGFTGKILHVDLTHGTITTETPEEKFYRTYWGGSAMGLYYLLKNTPPKADPLGPQNTLSFFVSASTGVAISGQSRCTATAKSPLTDLVGDAQAGGFWPAELKFSGFDGVVITGQSVKPVYLWIHDGQAELKDASNLWGHGYTTGQTEKHIRTELGDDKIEVAQIGVAGEKLSNLACIINMSNRAWGRTGLGAVMGSKNLKAIAVRGKGKPEVADKKAIIEMNKAGTKGIPENGDVKGLQDYGTASVLAYQNSSGGLPTRNYDSGFFDERADAITGEKMADTILKDNDTCYACTVRCKRVVESEYKNVKIDRFYGGPEYETLATFGSYCGINDLNALALAHQLCAEYGVDTIGTGATIAFAMDLFEHGVINTNDTGGVELKYGNTDAMLSMLQQMINKEGFGVILAQGSAKAAKQIGRGAEDYALTVKGAELPAHMPQVKRSLEVIYAVNPFGADHQSSEHDPMYAPAKEGDGNFYLPRLAKLGLTSPQRGKAMNADKVKFAFETQKNYAFLDTAALCQFVWGPAWTLFGPDDQVTFMQAVTGWDVTLEEIQQVGERRINMMRAFNAREGAGRDKDTLPKKLFKPLSGGRSDGLALPPEEFESALDTYYDLAGWDKATGQPTKEKLAELGLEWV
jgi:aldehyde:ferredoxin oxidoreductase